MEGRWFGGGAVIGDEEVVGCWFGWCIHVTFLPAKSKSALSIADNIFPPNRGAPLRYGVHTATFDGTATDRRME